MQRTWRQRLGAALIGAVWALPAAGAMSAALHVALHHHDHLPAGDHRKAIELEAVAHGHGHAQIVPEHDHPGVAPEVPVFLKAAPAQVPFGQQTAYSPRAAELQRPIDSRAGPPDRLFYAHCSLLL